MANALTVFRNGFLTLKTSALGRLVTDAKNPAQDYWPEEEVMPAADQVETGEFQKLRQAISSGSNTGLGAKLSRLLFGGVSVDSLLQDRLQADKVHRYLLKQPRSYFHDMCADNKTRQWIEKAMRDCPLFLVSGLITLTQSGVTHEEHKEVWASGQAGAPLGERSAQAPPAALDQTGIMDIGLDAHAGRDLGERISFIVPGERVVGVQYRKLKFVLLSGKDIDKATLERKSTRWKMFLGVDRGSEDDIIEADLQDGLTEYDLEIDDEEDLVIWDASE